MDAGPDRAPTTGHSAISATMSGVLASVGVTEIRSIRSLMIAPTITVLPVRKSQQLVAVAIHHDGNATEVTSVAKWSSSGNSIAIVSTSGLVTALASGQVTIAATLPGVS